jgi:RimJ/RimL family protein N-acetyltransferase
MTLRPATVDDEAFVLTVRNDPDVRANSRTDAEKDGWWYGQCLGNPYNKIYIVEDDQVPIGFGSLHLLTPTVAEISLAVALDYRSKGHGSKIIEALIDLGRTQGVTRFFATVRGANVPSLRSFLSQSFVPTKWVYLERRA